MQIPPDGFGTHGVFANDPFGIAFYSGGDRARRTPVGAVASADKTRVRGFDFDKGPGAEAAVYDEGRRSKHFGRKKIVNKSYQTIAEERAVKKYVNCEVLNSYYAGEDGKYYWYEVILVDKAHPNIMADPKLNWISRPAHTRRVSRGLTSSAKKSRKLGKGKGYEKR